MWNIDWFNGAVGFVAALIVFFAGVIVGARTQNPEDPWEDTDEELNIWDSR